jgi:long-chain acyl-CoA synthetase
VAELSFQSLPDMFLKRVEKTPDAPAYMYPDGASWRTQNYRELGEKVRAVSAGLAALGLKPEERCAILASTRIEWIWADLGILCAGGATTTIYPSSTSEDCAYILKDSESVIVFAENADQVAKVQERRGELPHVHHVVVFDGESSSDGFVLSFKDLVAKGTGHASYAPEAFARQVAAVRNDALATLIYTSGTTGRPKGVELIHDCWVFEGEGIDNLGLLHPSDLQYFWLPLAHVFGKVFQAAQMRIGFCTAVDGRIDKLVENLGVVRPTFVAAVPRIFEKVHNKVLAGAKEGSPLKAKIFAWAFEVGRAVSALRQKGVEPAGLLATKHAIADKLVFSKIRNRFGGRVRFFVSGSAPLSRELAEFFHAAGILILEGYGLTESSAASFVNRPDRFKFGTVGPPIPGTEVRIADDGEVLIKSRGVMRGYHRLPDATGESLKNGWLHTGDIGVIEPGGFLKLTDRKKDLIKTSGGKYVAPQSLEGKFKVICPYVSQIVVHGDGRNYCVALISLEEEALRKWARESGLGDLPYAELAAHPKTREMMAPYVSQLNSGLASYETIKKFSFLPADLTVEAGELTPSMKLKRKFVEQKYRALLDALY